MLGGGEGVKKKKDSLNYAFPFFCRFSSVLQYLLDVSFLDSFVTSKGKERRWRGSKVYGPWSRQCYSPLDVSSSTCCKQGSFWSLKSHFESMDHVHERPGATASRGWQQGCGSKLVPFFIDGRDSSLNLCLFPESLHSCNLILKGEKKCTQKNKTHTRKQTLQEGGSSSAGCAFFLIAGIPFY